MNGDNCSVRSRPPLAGRREDHSVRESVTGSDQIEPAPLLPGGRWVAPRRGRHPLPEIVTPLDVETVWRIPRSSQKKQRALGTFAPHYRVGRRVYYRRTAIEQWIAQQERASRKGWWSLMDQEEAPSRDQRTRGDSENTSSVGQPSTDGEVASAALDRSFLRAVFGDAEGYAHFAVGRGARAEGNKYCHKDWQPLVFRWPRQADEAVRTVNAALAEPGLNDVYVCPNILKTDKRKKGTAVTHRLLHSDADLRLDFSKVAALMGFAVGSGSPGHAHVYVPLAREVTLAEYQVLMRGMRDYFGGDRQDRR